MIRSTQRILDTQIGANLRDARNAAALDAGFVAHTLGLSVSEVLAIEAGQRRLNAREVSMFAKILQVEIHTIFGDTVQTESRTGELSIDQRDLFANLMMQGRQNSNLQKLVSAMQNQTKGASLQEHAA